MAESENPSPGRPRKQLSGQIVELLEETDNRAMTLGMITEHVDGARRTVKDRVDKLVEEERIEHQQIGNATAYWIEDDPVPEPVPVSDGYPGVATNMGDSVKTHVVERILNPTLKFWIPIWMFTGGATAVLFISEQWAGLSLPTWILPLLLTITVLAFAISLVAMWAKMDESKLNRALPDEYTPGEEE